MRTRLAGAAIAVLLAATVVSGAPSPAGARTLQGGALLACSTQSLPQHATGTVHFTATLGGTTAKLVGDPAGNYERWLKQPKLVLTDSDATWQVRPHPAPDSFIKRYLPMTVGVTGGNTGGYVCLARFPGHAQPLAVVGVNSGGAHCCSTYRVFDLAARQEADLDTGNSGAALAPGDRHALLQSSDDTFSYVFTAFAFSGHPIQLFRPDGTGFTDVTRQHPGRIRTDARLWWRAFQQADDGRGVLAAWAADQELLGRDQHVLDTLSALQDDKRLAAHSGDHQFGWPGGKRYVDKLLRFLNREGYRS